MNIEMRGVRQIRVRGIRSNSEEILSHVNAYCPMLSDMTVPEGRTASENPCVVSDARIGIFVAMGKNHTK